MQPYDPLRPWVVRRRLPNCQNITVARFQRRNDAEQYLATLRHLIPTSPFLITLDPTSHPSPAPMGPHQPQRLRHYLVGSPTDTQQAIDRLHLLGYTERIVWSSQVHIPDDGLVIRPDLGDVLRYTQRERKVRR